MKKFGTDDNIKIDIAHAEIIKSLVMASKPSEIIEFGIGGGRSTDAILSGLDYNQQKFNYTLVDNWLDFGHKMPEEVFEKYGQKINLVTSPEKEFVYSCQNSFDFIMSDADHHQTNLWFEYVYEKLLKPKGILIYHDVDIINNTYPNLTTILDKVKQKNISHFLFNKNSLESEKCHRGLLTIFKN